jgi:uncharacterized protein (TIRG00374 family)
LEKLTRKRITNFAKIIIGLGLVVFLTFYVEPKSIYETYKKADKIYFLVAFLLLPLNLGLQFFKWKILSKEYFGINDNNKIWLSLFYGISGGIFTPMKSGEYFARALPYKNVKVLDVILATIVDKFIPIFFAILIGGTFFIIFLKNLIGFSAESAFGFIILYKIIVLIPLFLLLGSSSISQKMRKWLKTKRYFENIINRVAFVKMLSSKTLLKIIVISLLYHLTFTTQMSILLMAFSGESNFIMFFFIANLIIFAQIVIPPIALGEVGVREGAAVYFLQNLGFIGAVGFNAAISLFFINLLIPSIIGLTLLLKRE